MVQLPLYFVCASREPSLSQNGVVPSTFTQRCRNLGVAFQCIVPEVCVLLRVPLRKPKVGPSAGGKACFRWRGTARCLSWPVADVWCEKETEWNPTIFGVSRSPQFEPNPLWEGDDIGIGVLNLVHAIDVSPELRMLSFPPFVVTHTHNLRLCHITCAIQLSSTRH